MCVSETEIENVCVHASRMGIGGQEVIENKCYDLKVVGLNLGLNL